MSTFTISQQPESTNLYLYPSGYKYSGMIPVGETNNWECVDDTSTAPDITTYVYTISATTVYDLYTVENHTTETGTINYVQVLCRAQSNGLNQGDNGTYSTLLSCSGATEEGSNKDITQTYANYSDLYTSQPSTGLDWTWVAVDSLQSGVSCNSPLISGGSVNMDYQPCADKTGHELSCWTYATTITTCTPHYTRLIDTADPTRYGVGTTGVGGWLFDSYHTAPISETSITSNIIQSVQLTTKCRKVGTSGRVVHVKPTITVSGTTACGVHRSGVSSFNEGLHIFNDTWTSQPSDSSIWTAAAVNNMKIGFGFKCDNAYCYGACHTQQFTVNYTEDLSPQIRTTQNYIRVNYVPPASTVTLTMPDSLQVSHSRQISRHTFYSGDYNVDDYGRSGKTLTIGATETSSTTATMQDLKDICHFGAKVTVAGLPDSNLNTDYHIVDYSFQQQGGEVDIYRWSLTLEED